jgi:hypothetical protein
VPFKHLSADQFGFDLLTAMQAAFDAGCQRLRLDESDPMRATLATTIIELATEGPAPDQLSERVLLERVLLERALEKISKRTKRSDSRFRKLRKVLSPIGKRRSGDQADHSC